MTRPLLALPLALALCGTAVADTFTLNGREFTAPAGFTVEAVAGHPLTDRPIVADFDERGRLYVADSSGSNDKVANQLAEKPHRVVRLEDTDGDGKFDHSTVFADRMMFPEGAMWLDGSLYVAAPPSIWKLTDTDDDGVADRREEWYQGKTLTGCANDLHGPYAGLDGWVYWCKGAFAEQTHERPGKTPLVSRASHVFRCRPDGTGLEPVMTGGMDNPVELVFTPGGERVFTTTFLQSPAGGKRDGLIHAVYGGLYGKAHSVLDGHVRTGPDLMPPLTHLGPAAPSGLARLASDALGAGYRDALLATQFNLRKVSRHVLENAGATFQTKDTDFLTSTHQDFHPTDVLEDADGSVLVVDTGGWYKLCCPTSQLEKPDVLGAIYRVSRKDAPRVDDPRGLKLGWDKLGPDALAALLNDPRAAVRRRAVNALGKLGKAALPALATVLASSPDAESRRNAVWAATRIDDAASYTLVRSALGDRDETVRQAAAHSSSVRRDAGAAGKLLALLKGESPQNRRAAAEALGRVGGGAAVPALLEAAGRVSPSDRVLQHSITYALIEIADAKATGAGLASDNPATNRAALVALDQMGDRLDPLEVAIDLEADDRATRETAAWVVGRHPEWADRLAGYLRARFSRAEVPAEVRGVLAGLIAGFASAPALQAVLVEKVLDRNAPADARRLALRAIERSSLKEAPAAFTRAVARALGDPELAAEAVKAARALAPAKADAPALTKALLAVAKGPKTADALKLEALAALPDGLDAAGSPALFDFLRAQLDPDLPVPTRSAAAGVIARATLSPAQLKALAASVPTAGPLELDKLLTPFEKSHDEALGHALVAALKASPALASLRVDRLKARLAPYGPAVGAEAEALYAALNADASKQKAYLDGLVPLAAKGDVRRGQTVFNGTKAACRSCHAIGYVGGSVGPDLSKVGAVRTDRDLLEAILYPSVSFVRSYEPVTLALKSGKVLNGVLRNESSDELLLVLGADDEARVPRAEVEEMRPGTVSVMPAGLDQQLTREELADLVAFLKSRQ